MVQPNAPLVNKLDLFDERPARQQTSLGVSYYQLLAEGYLIDYVHPQARCAANVLYYGLIDAVREIVTAPPILLPKA